MQKILTLKEIQNQLKDRNLRKVSEIVGLNYHTILRISKGIEKNPRYETLTKLSDYLTQRTWA